jgi:hypothetical protein
VNPSPSLQRLQAEAGSGLEHLQRIVKSPFVRVSERPVLVLGNHKAGTSAVAGLLGALVGETPALELRRELKKDRYRAVHEGTVPFSSLVAHNKVDFSRKIIKENHLSTMPDQVMAQFPESPIVMVVREPRDNIRSLLNRLVVPGNLDQIPADVWETIPDVWKLVLEGRWLGLAYDTYIEQLALRWNLIVDHYLAHSEEWMLQRYEDFRADKIGQLTLLAKAVGLTPRRDISSRLSYPFQPAGNRHVAWNTFYGEKNLATIERICGSRMKRLGYPLDRESGDAILKGAGPLTPWNQAQTR